MWSHFLPRKQAQTFYRPASVSFGEISEEIFINVEANVKMTETAKEEPFKPFRVISRMLASYQNN